MNSRHKASQEIADCRTTGDWSVGGEITRKWRRYLYLASVGSNSAVRALR
jgi:hypothetical protein